MSDPPSVPILPAAVIVCSRDRAEMLHEAVGSILGGGALPAELIVVDQSDRRDAQLASLVAPADCRLRYVHQKEKGLSRGNNLAASLATQELLVFTHDDVWVATDWLAAICRAAREAGPSTVITGRILAGERGHEGGYAPTLRTGTEPQEYRGRIGIDVLKPLNMAIPRPVLERVGGFDERLGPGTPFPGAEDADLGFRMLEAGFTIRFAPDALVYHRAWRTEDEYLPLRWRYGVAHGAFYAKHFRWRDPHVLHRWARDAVRRLRGLPRRLLREGRRGWGDVAFLAGNLLGILRWRRASRSK